MAVSPPSGYLELAGHTVEYRVFGTAGAAALQGAPRIVLLHEGLGCIALWRDFPDRLAQALGEPILAWSRYGYGQSDVLAEPRPVRFMHDEAGAALPELLDHFGIAAPILVGHSDGASIALIHAGAGPAADQAAAAARGTPRHGQVAVVALAPHLFVEPVGLASIARARELFDTTDLEERMARYHRDPRRTFLGWSDIWLDPEFAGWNIEAEVARIRCPVLAIQGLDDEYGTLRQIHRLAELTPATRLLELPSCAHSPHQDQPDRVIEAITRFVQALSMTADSGTAPDSATSPAREPAAILRRG